MKWYEYGNGQISTRELAASVTSMIIGIMVLTLPRTLALWVQSSDGWICIAAAFAINALFAFVLAKLIGLLHPKGFYAFAASIITAPAAVCLTGVIAVYFLFYCAYEVRGIANIAKQYLFERTPVEYIALAFLLVVTYAVSGSREGVIRLNLLFLPLVVVIAAAVMVFSAGQFRFGNLKPFFTSDWTGIVQGTKSSVFAMFGYEVLLFYGHMLNNPKKAPKAALIGVLIPAFIYLAVYLICVGVFTQDALKEVVYPMVELAKEAQIPGEFFERFESIFFTIWIMTIFNSACMAFDIAVYLMGSLTERVKRMTWVFLMAPAIYLICMIPRNAVQFEHYSTFYSYMGAVCCILIPSLLYVLARIRGVKRAL